MNRPAVSALPLFAALGLACGPPQTEAPAPSPRTGTEEVFEGGASEIEPVVIRINDGPKPGEDEQAEEWALLEEMFEEANPDVDLVVTDWEYDAQGFVARALSGDLETVVKTWATEGFRMIQEGHAADITGELQAWPHWEEIDLQVASSFMRDGRWYAIPTYAYSMGLALNRQRFTEVGRVDDAGQPIPPNGWDELREVAREMSDADSGIYGFVMQAENPNGGWLYLSLGWQGGGRYETQDASGRWLAAFDTPEIAAGFQMLRAMRWADRSMPPSALTRQNEAWQMFASGQAAMTIEPAARHFFDALSDEYEFPLEDIVFAPLPAGPAGRAHQMGADFWMVNAQASEAERDAAVRLITFMFDPEWVRAKCALRAERGRVVGYPEVPVLRGPLGEEVAATVERFRNLPRQWLYEAGIEGTLHPEPPVACQALYREVLSPTLQAVLGDVRADPLALLSQFAPVFQRQHLDPFNQAMGLR